MNNYKNTCLWKNAFSLEGPNDANILRLIAAYESFRNNTAYILSKIQADFPYLTLHDISHIDSLWDVGSVITGDNYKINPLEGFILGGAFLLHDSALSYDVYGGIAQLRKNPLWCDRRAINKKDVADGDIDFLVIRELHAEQCKTILDKQWSINNELKYLLDDDELRNYYCYIIGEIAKSHHLNIEDLEHSLNSQINPLPSFPAEWIINPIKLACILRCADATHLDAGRAPYHLLKILTANNISKAHWIAQNHLGRVSKNKSIDGEICFTSIHPYKKDEFAAWNVAFDAIKVANNEIIASNRILKQDAFYAKCISGVFSRKELNRYLSTDGWTPCEANIHVSNLNSVIKELGGSRLYGDKDQILIILRELIQNARDAIIAREYLDPKFKSGKISIHVDSMSTTGVRFSIEDNGVGMSERVLTTTFLDFGQSLWLSDLVTKEHKGLVGNGFKSIGKYGIGFYSVFMLADQVEVISKHYTKGNDDICTLSFPNGLTISPILQKGNIDEFSTISTRVNFTAKLSSWSDLYLVGFNTEEEPKPVSFKHILSTICAGLDVDVYLNETCIHQDLRKPDFDKKMWFRDISYADEQNNPRLDNYIEENYQKLDFVKSKNRIIGLAAINTTLHMPPPMLSLLTINGLTTNIHFRHAHHFIGYLDVNNTIASRNELKSNNFVDEDAIHKWIDNQKDRIDITSVDIAPGFTANTMQFKHNTKDFGQINLFYNQGEIIGPLSYTEIVNRIYSGGILYIFISPQTYSSNKVVTKGIIEWNLDGGAITNLLQNNRNDMVVYYDLGLLCSLPLTSIIRYVSIIKNAVPNIFAGGFLQAIFEKAQEMEMPIQTIKKENVIKFSDGSYRHAIIVEKKQ